MLVRAMAVAALLAGASALPQMWQPADNSTAAHRQLQAAGACNGMMIEMQPISQHCCGNNFEFCQGAVPSQCSAECQPVFESFYSRCQAMITADVNRAEYMEFQTLCHPATQDASDILFQDDFESGIGKWRGQAGSTPETATVESVDGSHVLQVNDCKGGGDAYSVDAFECSAAAPCLVSYRMKGRGWQGFSSAFPENHIWTATPTDWRGGTGGESQHVTTSHDVNNWHDIEYVFPVGTANYQENDYTVPITNTHFMLEGFDFDCSATAFDDIVIRRYTGSAEQAAAINAAFQPAEVLFADDFESGSGGWHGQGDHARPESALVMEDPDGDHGMVLTMADCASGGDAFSTETFECSPTNKCRISYYIKGRAWQGFSDAYAGNHIWAATPDPHYNGGVGVHVQTVHDTGNWHHVDYVFPVDTENFIHGDSTVGIGDVHFMIEGFDADCEATYLDDIVITRFSGSDEAAAGINRRANVNIDILFSTNFEDHHALPDGAPPRGWAGQGGPPNAPQTAVLATDPDQGRVLAIQGCGSGGDAFTIDTVMCTPQFQCSVSFRTKGNAWQGFADGYAGNHVWSATSDSGYNNGEGVHTQTVIDPDHWHLVEYIFPVTDTHVHGDASEPISQVRFMFEGFQTFCDTTYLDDIVIRRHNGATQAWCTAGRECITQSSLPSSLIGYWPLDGDGADVSGSGLDATPSNGEWVAGMYNQAFRFDGDDELRVNENPILELTVVTMMAWVRPVHYDVSSDRGIIMNKEGSYEFGIEDQTGALQGAFNSGCWRWWGTIRVPAHEWTHVAVGYDGQTESHYISGEHVEDDPCPGGDLVPTPAEQAFHGLKIGARGMCRDETAGWSTDGGCDTVGADFSQFRGDIDEAMLFSDAISQPEIYSIYHRAYDATAGGEGITFIRAPSVANVQMLPAGIVGFWPLDGDGDDMSGHNLGGTPTNPDWVAGLYDLAFRFDGDDAMVVPYVPALDLGTVTMSAWLRPVEYNLAEGADRGIILNKEGSYEMGLEDTTGALQGAFSPCWRWFGSVRVPIHEWTHVAMTYDGASETHFVHGINQETDPCGDGGAITNTAQPLRVGARAGVESFCGGAENCDHSSQFQGDIDEVMLFGRALQAQEIANLKNVNYRTGGGMTNVYAAGEPDMAQMPGGCVGFWPLDGDGQDLAAGNTAQPNNEEWVKGLFGLAFRFDGDDSLRVTRCNKATAGAWNLDVSTVTMLAWMRPQGYDIAYGADRGIVMNKENSYEFGLADNTGALQGAFSPCWRWWGEIIIPLHEWSHVAVAYDGTNEAHFISSRQVEATACGAGGDLTPTEADFRIGHRESDAGRNLGHSNFVGDIDEAMVFDRALGESDLHEIYRGHYRSSAAAGGRNPRHTHSLNNNGISPTGDSHSYTAVRSKLLRHLPSLVGFWPLDGDATDATGNGLDGAVSNAQWVTGTYGLAISFDGTDGIIVQADVMQTQEINQVTMAAWVKAESGRAGGAGAGAGATFEADHGIIMNKENVYEYGVKTSNGALQGAFGTQGDRGQYNANGGCWRWWGNIVIPPHEWVHTAVSFDGTTEYHYVSGIQVEQTACDRNGGGDLSVNDHHFYIGQRDQTRYTDGQQSTVNNVHGHSDWRGDIDEAMLFNTAITAEEVDYIYNLRYRSKTASAPALRLPGTPNAAALPSSLVGFWPLDLDGTDLGPHGLTGMDPAPMWVAGKYNLALNFDGGDGFVITDPTNALSIITSGVTMMSYVRPAQYEVCADRGIIMSKEGAFEYGLESNTGAMQGAKDTGCWRWWGNVKLGLYDWTQTAVSFDGTDEIHWVNGVEMERDACPGAIAASYESLRIGARADCSSCSHCGGASGAPDCVADSFVSAAGSFSQFIGDIDEAMLFSEALSARQMSDIHQAAYRVGADPLPTSGVVDVNALKQATGAGASGKVLIGFWPLDGDGNDLGHPEQVSQFGQDMSGTEAHLTAVNAQFVAGLFGQAFHFIGNDRLEVTDTNGALDADFVTMIAWIRPINYDVDADRGIIMNKEGSYEMGLEDNTGNLQGAFHSGEFTGGAEDPATGVWTPTAGSFGCWRWWGHIRMPLHEWSHVGVQYDGTSEKHYVNGMLAETGACPGDPAARMVLDKTTDNLRIGARSACFRTDDASGECQPTANSQFRGDIDEVMLFSADSPANVRKTAFLLPFLFAPTQPNLKNLATLASTSADYVLTCFRRSFGPRSRSRMLTLLTSTPPPIAWWRVAGIRPKLAVVQRWHMYHYWGPTREHRGPGRDYA
jgi:hypothetical protein